MSDSASRVEFFISGGGTKGSYLMYNPPVVGDDVTWGEDTYTVIRRNVIVHNNDVHITIQRKDEI
jgi:hypothetical protein